MMLIWVVCSLFLDRLWFDVLPPCARGKLRDNSSKKDVRASCSTSSSRCPACLTLPNPLGNCWAFIRGAFTWWGGTDCS